LQRNFGDSLSAWQKFFLARACSNRCINNLCRGGGRRFSEGSHLWRKKAIPISPDPQTGGPAVASDQSKRQPESAKERSKRKAKIFNAFRGKRRRMVARELHRDLSHCEHSFLSIAPLTDDQVAAYKCEANHWNKDELNDRAERLMISLTAYSSRLDEIFGRDRQFMRAEIIDCYPCQEIRFRRR
jgi:hypothetical protein